jgi:hypothetical protein
MEKEARGHGCYLADDRVGSTLYIGQLNGHSGEADDHLKPTEDYEGGEGNDGPRHHVDWLQALTPDTGICEEAERWGDSQQDPWPPCTLDPRRKPWVFMGLRN